jgi:hypothetical protein
VARTVRGFASPVLVYSAVVLGWSATCAGGESAAVLFRYRAVSLFWGVSPVWPPVLLCLLLLYFSYSQFRRHGSSEIDRPRLALCNGTDVAAQSVRRHWDAVRFKFAYYVLNAHIAARFRRAAWLRIGCAALFATVALLLLWRPAQAFEARAAYSFVLRVELAAILFWLGTALYDIWFIGDRLAKFLALAELLPLGEALRSVAKQWPRQTIWAFRLRQSAIRLLIRRQMLAALALRKHVASGPEAESDFRLLSDLTAGGRHRARTRAAEQVRRLEQFQRGTAQLARKILWRDLVPVWEKTPWRDGEPERAGAEQSAEQPSRGSGEFVALQFARFIVYAVEQLEREAKCVWMSFLILLVFFNSYNLQGPQFVARTLAVVFVIILVDVVRVFMPVERDSMVSWISRSVPGKLNSEFWTRLVLLGGLPLVGIVGHLFPELSEFLSRWVTPSIDAVR